MTKPTALIILDGFACRNETVGNAVAQANKPNFDRYWNQFPHSQLTASGEAVGLPEGQMGNSEVGHLNIGAGRVVYQSLTRINKSIREGDFFTNPTFIALLEKVKAAGGRLHVMGLLSDGGVHSHYEHLHALLRLAKDSGVAETFVHGFLDGRDVGPATAIPYVQETERVMAELAYGKFATISGRYYAMDRDKRWERVQLAFDAIVNGQAPHYPDAVTGIQASYEGNIVDEFVIPFTVGTIEGPTAVFEQGDGVIFFNFRPDRAIQLATALTNSHFTEFDRGAHFFENLPFVSFTEYSDTVIGEIAYEKQDLKNTIGEVLSAHGKTQLRIAETEKYPHVTFFMSGGRHEEFPGEGRILINSPKVATYDLQPEMSAYEVTDALVEAIENDRFDAILLNFANPDMVGHSGMLDPTIKAIEAVDECLGRVVDAILAKGGEAIITADHGNADEVITTEGNPMTAHTTNPVPVIVTRNEIALRNDGILADLAPTMLDLMGIEQPVDMTGKTLLEMERR